MGECEARKDYKGVTDEDLSPLLLTPPPSPDSEDGDGGEGGGRERGNESSKALNWL